MIITFCGHSAFCESKQYERQLLDFLEQRIGNEQALFYLGGYGGFDSFALSCARKYKQKHSTARLIYVTPYMDESYQKNHLEYDKSVYDEIIYPEIERVPRVAAIVCRNYWMADRADVIVAYISYTASNAYKMYSRAKNKGKEIYNLGKLK